MRRSGRHLAPIRCTGGAPTARERSIGVRSPGPRSQDKHIRGGDAPQIATPPAWCDRGRRGRRGAWVVTRSRRPMRTPGRASARVLCGDDSGRARPSRGGPHADGGQADRDGAQSGAGEREGRKDAARGRRRGGQQKSDQQTHRVVPDVVDTRGAPALGRRDCVQPWTRVGRRRGLLERCGGCGHEGNGSSCLGREQVFRRFRCNPRCTTRSRGRSRAAAARPERAGHGGVDACAAEAAWGTPVAGGGVCVVMWGVVG